MTAPTLSEQQIRLLFFQFYDDQIVSPAPDVVLSARVLRALEEVSAQGVLAKILEEGRAKRRLEILAPYREADAEFPCVRLLDYVDV